MSRFAKTTLLCFILLLSLGCHGDSNKKSIYELQERCGKTAERWAKTKPGEILEYRAHYNAHLNKCFILATLSPIVSNNFFTSFNILYDVNENKEYGHHTNYYRNDGSERHDYIIGDKYYAGRTEAQGEQKWREFVKEIMEE
jgi:hypothetical protein